MSNGIYIIVGEASGDIIGSKIISELKKLDDKISVFGIGGPEMLKLGFNSLFPISKISLMGFFEILPHIFELKRLINFTVEDICAKNPKVVVTIDAPGFCRRVMTLLKQRRPDIYTIHIVAPSVWAYKPSRAQKFAQVYDHMLTLLPFEPPFFHAVGMEATCIGHPVFEQEFGGGDEFRKVHSIDTDTKIILVTPGSRKCELARHLPIFIPTLDLIGEHFTNSIVCFAITNDCEEMVRQFLIKARFKYIITKDAERLKAYAAADVALAKSGTNTIEISASGTPMIVAYKLHPFTAFVLKRMIKIKYASLVNIIAGKETIPEYIQSDCNVVNLFSAIKQMLENPDLGEKQVKEASAILKTMGAKSKEKPSAKAAKIIFDTLRRV